jgi:type II secretory pathway pseudopilin PulG
MTIPDIRRSDEGFTLVELLVATTMALIVFAVTLSTLGVFNDTSQALTHRNDSQNQARLAGDQIVSQLRNAASSSSARSFVERAGPYDLVFQTVSVAGGSSALVRYCVPADPAPGTPATEELIQQTQSPATSTIPWSTACPDTASGSSVLVGNLTNRYRGAARAVFTYNGGSAPSDLTTIQSIGIDLFVNTTPADSNNEYELQSSALLRNAQPPPVAAFTWSQGASGTVVLDGGSSYSPSDQPLTYAWSCAKGGSAVSCPSSGSTNTWTPTSGTGTYTVSLTVTDQAGLPSTPFTSTVTVQ